MEIKEFFIALRVEGVSGCSVRSFFVGIYREEEKGERRGRVLDVIGRKDLKF